MRHERFREFRLVVEKTNHGCFLQPHDPAFLNCLGCRHSQGLPGQASLAAKFFASKNCNYGFFPMLGKYDELYLPVLDVEDGIRRLTLRKDNLTSSVYRCGPSAVCLGEEGLEFERRLGLASHCVRARPSRPELRGQHPRAPYAGCPT